MKLRFLALVALVVSSSVMALDNCGTFNFTNSLHENLYIVVDPASRPDFCSGAWLPQVILPGQTVAIPITPGKEPFIDVTTQQNKVKIDANYFLKLSFQHGQYGFHGELYTQSFSWSSDKSKLAFCSNQTYADSAGNCFLFKN